MAPEKEVRPLTTKQAQAQLVHTIGERMRAARELCNLSQTEAARRLGYVNSSKLAKVERATDTLSVPLWLLVKASKVYQVSTDYLFGITDSFDNSSRLEQERETASWLFDEWQKIRVRDVVALRAFHNRLQSLAANVGLLGCAGDEVEAAFDKFVSVNDFEDMRCGQRLVLALSRLKEAVEHARAEMEKQKLDCLKATKGTALQGKLDLE